MNKIKQSCITILLLALGITTNAQDILFSETFSNCLGKGGNDDLWSGSIASNEFTPYNIYEEDNVTIKTACSADNEGWILENGAAANSCIKLGKGSALGWAQTPALSGIDDGDNTLTFRAGAWNSASESTKLNISISGDNAKLSHEQVILKKGEFTTYKVKISGATEESIITFSANVKTNNRFFIDDIIIFSGWDEEEGEKTIVAPTFSVPSESTLTEGAKIGLTAEVESSIYYTTDGTNPSKYNGALYTEEITINEETTIKAVAISGDKTSDIVTAKYYIQKTDDGNDEPEDVDAPAFGVESGLFAAPVSVEMTAGDGCVIRFTTDGSEPTSESELYEQPVYIEATTTLRAIAFAADGTASDVTSETYFILQETDTDDIVFRECGYDNAQAIASAPGVSEVVTFASVKGSKPAYYNTGNAVRIYSGSSVTVRSLWDIIAVEIGYAGASYSATEENTSVSEGTEYDYLTHTWSIGGKEATLTYTPTTGNLRIARMKFIYAVEAPVFSYDSGTTLKKGTLVEIRATKGARIYYTTDGSEPTEDDNEYTAPVAIDSDMTIRAVAVEENGNRSAVADASYSLYRQMTIAEMKLADNGTEAELMLEEAVVMFSNGSMAFLADTDGAIAIENIPLPELKAGTCYTGGLVVAYAEEDGVHKVIDVEGVTDASALTYKESHVTAREVSVSELDGTDDLTEQLVKVTGFVKEKDGLFYLTEHFENGADGGAAIDTRFAEGTQMRDSESENLPTTVTGIYVGTGTILLTENPDMPVVPEPEDVDAPAFGVEGGLFAAPVSVEMTAGDGCVIRFTTDGSEPTSESELYEQPVYIEATTTLRAIAFAADGTASDVTSETYFILQETDTDEIVFRECGYDNAQAIASAPGVSEVVTFASVKGSKPAYYNTGNAVRIYSGSSVTVRTLWDIIAVEIGYAGASYSATEENTSVSEGTEYDYLTHTWSIGGKEATLTYTPTTGNLRIARMKFIYAVEAPEISLESGTIKVGTTVEITYSADTEVFYTIDGTEPTKESIRYSEPIVVNKDMTIKAVAMDKDGNYSHVVQADYVTYDYTTIADAKQLSNSNSINLRLTNAVVTKLMNNGVYITDETGSIYLDLACLENTFKEGRVINGTIKVEYTTRSGQHIVVASESTDFGSLDIKMGDETKPQVVDFYDVFENDYSEALVEINGFVKSGINVMDKTDYYLVEDIDDDISYGIRIDNVFETEYNLYQSETANIIGIIRINNDMFEIMPVSVHQENTPIKHITIKEKTDRQLYNILGQPVDKRYRGIIIQKGKKSINK